ncbi:MAG: hypothetical protein VKJ46_08760 [Leptolyngbyaceae bacterium]|nr:hypothetical protein [Leptolyngbyaceae bacterium]
MDAQIATIFDEAESRYLKSEELNILSQYVSSLPQRLETYRLLRDKELEIMQQVADQLQLAMPQETTANLERCLKHALLMLRYCAMSMLLNDESFVKERLLGWLSQTVQAYNTQAIDSTLYRLLNQRLSQVFNPGQLGLLNPPLKLAQTTLLQPNLK